MTRQITLSKNTVPTSVFTFILTTGILATGSFTPASAQGIQEVAWLAGEIRGQMAVVNAQAEATLCECDEYDDVQDELKELGEKMDRFEQLLAEPIRSNQQLRRLSKAARRVDEQTEEVIEEIEDALEDLRDDRPRNRHHRRHLGYGQVPTSYYTLPPRFVSANQFGFTTPGYGQLASHRSSYRTSGIQITLGGGRPQIRLVSTPTQIAPYHVGHPIIGSPNHRPIHGPIHGNGFNGGEHHGNSAVSALRAEADRLHTLTCQLVRLLR